MRSDLAIRAINAVFNHLQLGHNDVYFQGRLRPVECLYAHCWVDVVGADWTFVTTPWGSFEVVPDDADSAGVLSGSEYTALRVLPAEPRTCVDLDDGLGEFFYGIDELRAHQHVCGGRACADIPTWNGCVELGLNASTIQA